MSTCLTEDERSINIGEDTRKRKRPNNNSARKGEKKASTHPLAPTHEKQGKQGSQPLKILYKAKNTKLNEKNIVCLFACCHPAHTKEGRKWGEAKRDEQVTLTSSTSGHFLFATSSGGSLKIDSSWATRFTCSTTRHPRTEIPRVKYWIQSPALHQKRLFDPLAPLSMVTRGHTPLTIGNRKVFHDIFRTPLASQSGSEESQLCGHSSACQSKSGIILIFEV
ncbi:hypothetical protein JTE90_013042 [Oedothorax gibbosus]|uniref:Uncharacterized protein n=1 Tax=Oedothorax gibbosus TaxID=931172 RepID=A0AAV6UGV5_9ARAC|nr:hypothetical protein JTE90_013042 [Oedothorax gibbosus]